MRFISEHTRKAWLSSYKGGSAKAVVRATIEPFLLETVPYDGSRIASTNATSSAGAQVQRSIPRAVSGNFSVGIFNNGRTPVELPNIKSAQWDASVFTDVASLTLELWNTEPLPVGQSPTDAGAFDLPGYFTPGRGGASEPSGWGNVRNAWQGMIAPDRLIRLFAGYGCDPAVCPEKDPYLYPYGLWLIDDVTVTDKAIISVQCRDIGRLLMEQLAYPPVIPKEEHPLRFRTIGPVTKVTTKVSTVEIPVVQPTVATAGWVRPVYNNCSNSHFVGKSLTDSSGSGLVDSLGGVSGGYYGRYAFDADVATYWLSVGAKYNSVPRWVEGSFSTAQTVSSVKVTTVGGPYSCYVSIMVGGAWTGSTMVPYTNGTDLILTDAIIPWVAAQSVAAGGTTEIPLPAPVANVSRVRVTFTMLVVRGTGNFNYRCAVADVQCNTGATTSETTTTTIPSTVTTQETTTVTEGEIGDWTDVCRWAAAWGGFYWPSGSASQNVLNYSDGTSASVPGPGTGDACFPSGRVWGDIQDSGTSPVTELEPNNFDKRPLLDAINLARETIAHNFFVNELGGIVFRTPNIWEVGNYVSPNSPVESPNGPANLGRTPDVEDLKDDESILSMTGKLSSRNVRETVLVGNTTGNVGATANMKCNNVVGPFETKMRRMALWCVDEDTEILTRRGWLRYDQVLPRDETLSIDESTGTAYWQQIKSVKIFPAEQRDMLKLECASFSAVTTPDHKWHTQYLRGCGRDEEPREWTWRWRTTETLTSMDRIPRALPNSDVPSSSDFPDQLVELVAWMYTEGSISRTRWKIHRASIPQSFVKHPVQCALIERALKEYFGPPSGRLDGKVPGWRRTDSAKKGISTYTLSGAAATEIARHLTVDKAPTMEFLLALTQAQLELFIEISIAGDGHVRFTSQFSKEESRFFYQNIGPRLDAFLVACAVAGIATSYDVSEPDSERNDYSKNPKAIVTLHHSSHYYPVHHPSRQAVPMIHGGPVWCPEMPKDHTWLARRDGSIYFTGNSDQSWNDPQECLVAAELILLRQQFTYRSTQITIPGHPGIQVDDQVKVWDRMTADTYLHYVSGANHEISNETGQWKQSLTTHWLGTNPFSDWAFTPGDISSETKLSTGLTQATVPAVNTSTTTPPASAGGSSNTGTPSPANYGWFHTTTTYTPASIAARYSISTSTLQGLNPKLTGATIGPQYQVKVRTNYGPVTNAVGSGLTYYGWWQATATSYTVASVAGSYGISIAALRSWNQWLVGDVVTQGQWVQIRSDADALKTS